MYKEFFGLASNPFELSPDPFFMVSSDRSKEALAAISSAIGQRKGFVVMTGEVGTGKTLVLRCLFELWEREQIPFAYFIGPRLSTTDFLNYIALELGIQIAERTKGNLLRALYGFLLAQYEKGLTTVLVIDEAHQVSRSVLEEIRLLTNFETAKQKLVQLVLVGQPELDKKLDSVELRSLKQRVAVRCKLEPLRPEEIRNYIERRLELAGANAEATTIFPVDTVKAIYHFSQGTPRLVNSICDQALITASASQIRVIPREVIEEIATRFRLQPAPDLKPTEKAPLSARHEEGPAPAPAKATQAIIASDEPAVKASAPDAFLLYLDSSNETPKQTTSAEKPQTSRKSGSNGYFSSYPRQLGQEAMDRHRLRQVLAEIDLDSSNSNANDLQLPSAVSTLVDTTSAVTATREERESESSGSSAIATSSVFANSTIAGPSADDRAIQATDSQANRAITKAPQEPAVEVPQSESKDLAVAKTGPGVRVLKRYDKQILFGTLAVVFILLAVGSAIYLRAWKTAAATSSSPISEQASAASSAATVESTPIRAASHSQSESLLHKPLGEASQSATKSSFGRVRLGKPKIDPGPKSSDAGDLGVAPLMERKLAGNLDELSEGLASVKETVAPPSSLQGGGTFKPALLINSVSPVYPAVAKNQRIHGDVRIDALIEADGHVSTMNMLAGPLLLQAAAAEALRQWKFQPATIDGKPVPMHYTVTVQFRLQ